MKDVLGSIPSWITNSMRQWLEKLGTGLQNRFMQLQNLSASPRQGLKSNIKEVLPFYGSSYEKHSKNSLSLFNTPEAGPTCTAE